ncbi:hypothetical protein D3M71_23960 [Erwinia billingiae]|nr:hypothetical protein [Erwinia billingiae]
MGCLWLLVFRGYRFLNNIFIHFFMLIVLSPARASAPSGHHAVMLRTEPAGRLCPCPFRAGGFPSTDATPAASVRWRISLAALRPLRTPRRSVASGVFMPVCQSGCTSPGKSVRGGLVVAPPSVCPQGCASPFLARSHSPAAPLRCGLR